MHSSYTRGGSNTICNVAWLLQSIHEICHEHLILQVVKYALVPRQLSGRGCESRGVLRVAAWEAGRGCESRDMLRVAVISAAWYLLFQVTLARMEGFWGGNCF